MSEEVFSRWQDPTIKQLQQENEQLKEKMNETLDRNIKYNVEIVDLKQENKQLQNNWNELKEYAKENLYFYSGYQGEDREEDLSIKYLLDKMQELEGSND